MSGSQRLSALRAKIAALEGRPHAGERIWPGLIDGGLALGCWHEVLGEGLETETAAAPAAFAALLATPLATRGALVWVCRRDDLYPPGLSALGLAASRAIFVRAPDEAQALAAMEDALATAGVAAVIGEAESPSLAAGRRLQLACEKGGAVGFVVGRRPFGGPARRTSAASGSAAASRWRVRPEPSRPPPGEPGLGTPRWSVTLERRRGGRTGAWIMEQDETDAAHPLRMVAELGDFDLAATQPARARA